jgi:hypothetical protein
MGATKHLFKQIKREFFPNWDRMNQWKIRRGSRSKWKSGGQQFFTHESGFCDREKKTIFVSDSMDNELVIIHEICHAVASGGHGVVWQERFRKAATRAAALGKAELSSQILYEIGKYHEELKYLQGAATAVYGQIENGLLDSPTATFDDILNWICCENGSTPEETLKFAKKAREVYERAKKRMLKHIELERDFKEKYLQEADVQRK